jgi:hypothetical protein
MVQFAGSDGAYDAGKQALAAEQARIKAARLAEEAAAADPYATKKIGPNGETQAQLDAIGFQKSAQEARDNAAAAVAYAAKLKADKVASDSAAATAAIAEAARIEAARIAAEQAIKDAATAAALKKAQDDLKKAQEAAIAAANAANVPNGVTASNNTSTVTSTSTYTPTNNISSANDMKLAEKNAADTAAADYAKAQAALEKFNARQDALQVMKERFKQYNLGTLADKIKDLAIDGATESTITFALQETPEYKERFKANDTRIKNNLKVLSPAEYINVEDSYRQVLRAYGLTSFDNDAYVSQFIANDMSPTELSDRVVTAVQRVKNADPAISKQLRDYYNINQEDLVSYVLDPQQQLQKIQRQVAASEIGVAAGRQGLTAGVSVAEQLAAQGVTQQQAEQGYASIASILPTAEKLSNIYGATQDIYGQSQAERETFNSLASEQRKRQKLSATEIGTFGTSSGMSRTSLTGTKPAGLI